MQKERPKQSIKEPKSLVKEPKKVQVKESKYESEEEEEETKVAEETPKRKKTPKDIKKIFISIIDPVKPLFTVKEKTPTFTKITADHLGLSITQLGKLKIRYLNQSNARRNIYIKQWVDSNLPHDIDAPKKHTVLDALIKRITNVKETEQISVDIKETALGVLESLKGDDAGNVFTKICFVPLKGSKGETGDDSKKGRKRKTSEDEPMEEKPKKIKDIIFDRYKNGFDSILYDIKDLPDNIGMGEAVEFVKGRIVSL
jgi:hypothetical protein